VYKYIYQDNNYLDKYIMVQENIIIFILIIITLITIILLVIGAGVIPIPGLNVMTFDEYANIDKIHKHQVNIFIKKHKKKKIDIGKYIRMEEIVGGTNCTGYGRTRKCGGVTKSYVIAPESNNEIPYITKLNPLFLGIGIFIGLIGIMILFVQMRKNDMY
jgi:hypothetical protein